MKERYQKMAKQKKFISLNGRTFQLKQRSFKNQVPIEDVIPMIISSSKMLDDCYQRPSTTKQAIFDSWFDWSCECDKVHGFGIRSYNTNIFTLQGYVMFNDYSYGIIDITPTHNYIWVDHLDMF